MMKEFAYPLDPEWSTDEMVRVIDFLAAVESVYESGLDVLEFQSKYRGFKEVVSSISDEKKLDKAFQVASNYSTYQAVKRMRELLKEGDVSHLAPKARKIKLS